MRCTQSEESTSHPIKKTNKTSDTPVSCRGKFPSRRAAASPVVSCCMRALRYPFCDNNFRQFLYHNSAFPISRCRACPVAVYLYRLPRHTFQRCSAAIAFCRCSQLGVFLSSYTSTAIWEFVITVGLLFECCFALLVTFVGLMEGEGTLKSCQM
jgi:hypothetical protein